MQRDVFLSKAESMGDFYAYVLREDTKTTGYIVATADLSTKYIEEQIKLSLRGKSPHPLPDTHVYLWDWTANRLKSVELRLIKKLVPLSTVLKNGD